MLIMSLRQTQNRLLKQELQRRKSQFFVAELLPIVWLSELMTTVRKQRIGLMQLLQHKVPKSANLPLNQLIRTQLLCQKRRQIR